MCYWGFQAPPNQVSRKRFIGGLENKNTINWVISRKEINSARTSVTIISAADEHTKYILKSKIDLPIKQEFCIMYIVTVTTSIAPADIIC